MIKNICIQPNDTIALACPGSKCDDEAQVIQTVKYLNEKYQLKSYYEKETFQSLPANMRAEIFYGYLSDPNIKLIWMLRGGEGSADLIPLLHKKQNEIKKLSTKLLLGFSDITALLLYFSQQFHWPVIHGFNARQLALNTISAISEKSTFDWLFNRSFAQPLILDPLNKAAEKKQHINAHIVGGNLSLINISIGDVWEIQTENKILFLEDVNEKPHAILRTLKYFNRIGLFKNLKGLILGQFINSKTEDEKLNNILKNWSKLIEKPVWRTLQIGHGKNNIPLPFYQKCYLKTINHNQTALFID